MYNITSLIFLEECDNMKTAKKFHKKSVCVLFIIFLLAFVTSFKSKALLDSSLTQIFTKENANPGSYWQITEVVSSDSTDTSFDPSLTVDSAGNIHIAWFDQTNYAGAGTDFDIFYNFWNATTESWNTTEVVSTESTSQSYRPSLAVDSAGNVHIAWEDYTDYAGSGTDRDIFYKRWNSSSLSWTTTEVVSTGSTSDYSCNPSPGFENMPLH